MSDVKNLGCHAGLDSIDKVAPYYDCFQVCLSSPMMFQMDVVQVDNNLRSLVSRFPTKQFVVHSPYWYNILIDNRFYKFSKKSIYEMLGILKLNGCKYFVIHPGSRGRKDGTKATQEESLPFFRHALETLAKTVPEGVKLLIENVPLSKMDTKGLSVDNYIKVIKEVNSDRIGFALDTQHAYCSGEDTARFMEYAAFADVIHLNANPAGIVPGSCRDRHSSTALFESEGLSYDLLKSIIVEFPDKLKIMEVDADVAVKYAVQELKMGQPT